MEKLSDWIKSILNENCTFTINDKTYWLAVTKSSMYGSDVAYYNETEEYYPVSLDTYDAQIVKYGFALMCDHEEICYFDEHSEMKHYDEILLLQRDYKLDKFLK